MNRRVWSLLLSIFVASAVPSSADEFADNFQAHLNDPSLDALAQDLGALTAGGSFHNGKALGFPIGFDIGAHAVALRISDDNRIVRDSEDTIPAVYGQAEVGLPWKINVIGRVGRILDADVIGGGIRSGIFTPSVPGLPALSVTGLYHKAEHDFFDSETYSANAVLSVDFPFIHPYVGGGYDYTVVEPTSRAYNGVAASVPRNLEGKSKGYRAEIGVNLSIIPFTYINLGAGLANGQSMYHAGVGAKF